MSALMVLMGVTTLFLDETFAESKPEIGADSAFVVSASTGQTVYRLHTDRKLSPGGFTKIMAAMVVLDRMHDRAELRNRITVTRDVASKGKLFKKGDQITVRDLLAAMLVADSDEAAVALAVYSAENVPAFVEAMNTKAQELELENTHYTTVTGKYDTLQYTTTEDMGYLVQAAFKYSLIEKYLTTETCATTAVGKTASKTLRHSDTFRYSGLVAAKAVESGTSKHSVNSFAYAERDGMKLISVIFGTTAKDKDAQQKQLLDYSYGKVARHAVRKAGAKVGKIKIRHGASTRVPVYTKSKAYAYVPKEGSDSLIRTQTIIYDKLEAPVKAGTKAGELQVYVADELTGTVDLVVKEDVKTGWFPSYLYISNGLTILIAAVLLCLLYFVLRIRRIRRRKRLLAERRRKQKIREIALREYEIEEDRKRRNWTYR